MVHVPGLAQPQAFRDGTCTGASSAICLQVDQPLAIRAALDLASFPGCAVHRLRGRKERVILPRSRGTRRLPWLLHSHKQVMCAGWKVMSVSNTVTPKVMYLCNCIRTALRCWHCSFRRHPLWIPTNPVLLSYGKRQRYHMTYYFSVLALFPGPFVTCSMEKRERAQYLPSCEHDVIERWQKFQNEKGEVLHIVQRATCLMLGVYDSHPPLARYVWLVTWYLSSSCRQCHVQSNWFYHRFYIS